MINIVLCGGSGTRLWPISRTFFPKQFVNFFENKSLFQLTIERNLNFCKNTIIVSNLEQYFLAMDQLEKINISSANYLLEPMAKNTAPAIALACLLLKKDDIVLVTPSDHLIKNTNEYEKIIKKAKSFANDDFLVTFGIKPTFANTGFGYIEGNGYDVKAFHEKPDLTTAKRYLEDKNFYWNSGIFCFKVGVFLEELEKYSPLILNACKNAISNITKNDFIIRIKHEDMEKIPSNSIDYALMEKSKKIKIIPADISWSDLGSFDSLYEEIKKDKNNNTIDTNHININSKNNLILSDKRKIVTIDMDDCLIVDTKDALLISKKGSSEKIKLAVEQLNKENSELCSSHVTMHRPWGNYTILEDSNGFKIKKIEVKPGKRLSLQKHLHRSEHWIVVSGTATVTVGDKVSTIGQNESTYIKIGELHRLANDGKIPLIIIEVQVGRYTGEDDIIRFEDDFYRK